MDCCLECCERYFISHPDSGVLKEACPSLEFGTNGRATYLLLWMWGGGGGG